jgi:hypothetical protein
MANAQDQKPVQISIELPAGLEPIYANLALILHTPSEMVLDFAQMMPNVPKAKIHARIVMTPMNAKLLHHALAENIEKFEQKYGEINVPQQGIMIDPGRGFTK